MIYDIFLYKERRAFMNLDIYSHNLTINYSDVDENNQVTNKGLLRLLQEVAGIHCGLLGYGVNDTPKTGLAWILLNWKLKVFARPKTNTNLLIKTWTRKKTPLFVYRDFEIYDNAYNLVAIASSKWVLFNVNNKSISRVTDGVNEKYIQVNKEVFPEKFEEKIKEPLNSEFVLDYTVQRRDIDMVLSPLPKKPPDFLRSSRRSRRSLQHMERTSLGSISLLI